MRQYQYTGVFKSADGHTYQLTVNCNGYLQAFFLLTAKAIQTGKHYQLHSITHEDGGFRWVDDIVKCSDLIIDPKSKE